MIRQYLSLAVCATALLVPRSTNAQTQAQVTLNVPVNLTELAQDISKVRLGCRIQSDPITAPDGVAESFLEAPTSDGQIVTTLTVVLSFTMNNPAGKLATVRCNLEGWSLGEQRWGSFGPAQASAFKANVSLETQTSIFVW
jgi:hypothetical protein